MNDDGTRQFKIDIKNKPKCGLTQDNIMVKKDLVKSKDMIKFSVIGYEKIAYIECLAGFIEQLKTKGKTEGCGIGKILMRLCLNEKTIHVVKDDPLTSSDNLAVRKIQNWEGECKEIPTCSLQNQERLEKIEKWVRSGCSKLVYLHMIADPKTGAYVYFNSAIESDYSQMLIKINHEEAYPKEGFCSVTTLKEQYNGEGEMVNGDSKVDVFRHDWFFCLPKPPATKNECTN